MRHFGISSAPNAADDPDFASDDLRMNVCYPRVAETTVPAHTPAAPHEAGTVTQFSRRPDARGRSRPVGAHGPNTRPTELFPFPPRSVREDPVRLLLEAPQLSNSFLDVVVGGLIGLALFITVIMLFVCKF